jgi:competence protein ComEA
MKSWRQLLLGVLIGLLTGGAVFLISRPVRGVPITLLPAATQTTTPEPLPTSTESPMRVQVGGEVVKPGIYELVKGSRLDDLINMAGGLTQSADVKRINLSVRIEDGDYFYMPGYDEVVPETAANYISVSIDSNQTVNFPIDINEADQEMLEALPGIGPTKAADILAYRDENGPFTSLEDLLNVPGIGPATLEAICDYLLIEP